LSAVALFRDISLITEYGDLETRVRDYSRSLEMTLFERSYMTYYFRIQLLNFHYMFTSPKTRDFGLPLGGKLHDGKSVLFKSYDNVSDRQTDNHNHT